MIKQLTQLTRDERLLLLEAIAKQEVDKDKLTVDTLFAVTYDDYFSGLMVSGSQVDKNTTIICLGPARKARAEMEQKEDIVIDVISDKSQVRPEGSTEPGGEIVARISMKKANFI